MKGISRRALIGAGAAASATMLGARGATGAETRAVGDGDFVSLLPKDRIGLQLYSVRDQIQSQGFDKVLAKMAEIGWASVEFAGYTQGSSPEITVKELRKLLDKHGLKAVGSHISPTSDDAMKKILDDAEALGMPQVGNASPVEGIGFGTTTDTWKTAAQAANHYGQMAAERGIGFYLHNHSGEFAPCPDDQSVCGHDIFLAECDPRFVFLELDIFWIYVGSYQYASMRAFDPLQDYILKHHDRYKLFHVKDGIYDVLPEGTFTDVGEGKIDYQLLFTELFKKSAPDRHTYLWENDGAADHPRGSIASAQASYVNLRYALKKAGSTADCATGPLSVAVNSARVRRSSAGGRSVAIGLRLSSEAKVAAKLTRGAKTLARTSRTLGKGTPTLKLAVPPTAAKGPALLTLTVSTAGRTVLTDRRTVRIP